MNFPLQLDQWGQLKHILLHWFTNPQQALLPLITITFITLFFKPFPYRNRILYSALALSLSYLILISPLGATLTTQGLTHFLPPDNGQPADAIVVLGRGPLAEQERAQAAARLWQAQRAPVILATGRGEAPRLAAQITQLGVPLRAQLVEPLARTTEENASHSSTLLQGIGAKRLILVTDQPHMLRSVLTFQSFGFQVIPHPIAVPPTLPAIEKTALALREYAGLITYALIGRFQPRTTVAIASPSPFNLLMKIGGTFQCSSLSLKVKG